MIMSDEPSHPRRKKHTRTSSSSKLTSIARPSLNKAKSTDAVVRIKRNNKSYTKINLQPLTKTLLSQSLKSNKSNSSLKNLNLNLGQGLKLSSRQGKAILRINDDEDYEDLSDDDQLEIPEKRDLSLQQVFQQALGAQDLVPQLGSAEMGISELPQDTNNTETPYTTKQHYDSSETLKTSDSSPNSNLYGGSLFLSQSTGLVRKIDAKAEYKPDFYPISDSSGLSFKANPINVELTTDVPVVKENSYQPNQSIFNNLQRTNNQYVNTKRQLQRSQQKTELNDNNFNDFLNSTSAGNSADNRTQQRLWLQRENSLMDVNDPGLLNNFSSLSLNKLMFAHNYNLSNPNLQSSVPQSEIIEVTNGPSNNDSGPNSNNNSVTHLNELVQTPDALNGLFYMVQSNPIQSRVEFERLNREYLNVRRYLNPVGESLNRVKSATIEVGKHTDKSVKHTNKPNNLFQEFSPEYETKELEINNTLNKLWQDALVQTLILKPGVTRPRSQRLPLRGYINRNTPTTKAVKMAERR